MKFPNWHRLLSAVAALGIGFSLPATAMPGLPKGLSLELFTGATYEDNYKLSGTDKQDDTYFNTGLSLTYQQAGSLGELLLRGTIEHEKHTEFDEDDGVFFTFHPELTMHDNAWTLSLAADVSRQSAMNDAAVHTGSYTGIGLSANGTMAIPGPLNLAASVDHRSHSFDDSEAEDLGHQSTSFSLTPYYTVSQKLALGLRAAHTSSSYEDDTRGDTDNTALGAVASYRLTGKVTTQLGTGFERTRFSSSAANDTRRDSDWYLDMGIDYVVSSKLSASFGASYGQESNYQVTSEMVEFPARRDAPTEFTYLPSAWYVDSYSKQAWHMNAALDYEVTSKFSASLGFSHGVEASYARQADDSYTVAGGYRTANRSTASLSYLLTNALKLRTSLGYSLFDEDDTGDKSSDISWDLAADYRFGERVALTGGYGFTTYQSDADDEDYRNNTFHLGLKAFF